MGIEKLLGAALAGIALATATYTPTIKAEEPGTQQAEKKDYVSQLEEKAKTVMLPAGQNYTEYNNAGANATTQQKYVEAYALLRKAVEVAPQKPRAYLNIGDLFYALAKEASQDNKDKTLAFAEAGLNQCKTAEELITRLGLSSNDQKMKDYVSSLSKDLWEIRGELYFVKGSRKEALDALTMAKNFGPLSAPQSEIMKSLTQ